MQVLWEIFVLLLGIGALLTGGELLVRAAISVALRIEMSPLIVGLTVVAAGTSAPELFTSMVASLKGANELAVGNILGSNIFNILVILGLSAAIAPIHIPLSLLRFEWPMLLVCSAVFMFLFWDLKMGMIEGIFCLILLAAMMYASIMRSKRAGVEEEASEELKKFDRWYYDVAFTGLGMALLALGGNFCVDAGSNLATMVGMSERMVGVTIVSVGTGLPELVTSLVAAAKKRHDIAVANVIGSNMMNTLGVAGATATVSKITVGQQAITVDGMFMFAVTVLLGVAAYSLRLQYTRLLGAGFLLLYIGYVSVALNL